MQPQVRERNSIPRSQKINHVDTFFQNDLQQQLMLAHQQQRQQQLLQVTTAASQALNTTGSSQQQHQQQQHHHHHLHHHQQPARDEHHPNERHLMSPTVTPIKPLPFSPSQFLNSPSLNVSFDQLPASTPVKRAAFKVCFFLVCLGSDITFKLNSYSL